MWRHAENGRFCEGVPAITVIVDGGSQLCIIGNFMLYLVQAIIFGKETGQLLYVGVHCKYFHACAMHIPQDRHTCNTC